MCAETQDKCISDIRLRIRPDDVLHIGLQADAAIDVNIVVRLKNILVGLDAGGAVAIG